VGLEPAVLLAYQPYPERRLVSCAAETIIAIDVGPAWRARLVLAGP